MRILLVEDDPRIADVTSRALASQGWAIDVTARGEPVSASVRRDPYDLVILDIGLAGIDGFEVLRRLRADGAQVPVIMLTGRDAVADRVRGLETGADDYLVKPFALAELVARVRVLARRREARSDDVLAAGELRMDLQARRAFVAGAPVELSVREWSVLECLLGRIGKVVAKEQIINAISGWEDCLSENAVEQYVSRLRTKIQSARVEIKTVRGFGYLLEAARARNLQA